MAEAEEWRPVVGYEGLYEVSDHGRVRSMDRVVRYTNGQARRRKGKVLAAHPVNKYGHLLVKLGTKRRALVHVLVAEAFIGSRPDGMEVRHLNGDPSCNCVSNLRYGTRSENQRDHYAYGGKHAWGKLNADDVREIRRRLSAGENQAPIAKDFGVSVGRVSDIKRRRSFDYIND